MPSVALPKRVGPKFGTFAFTEEGELQIYRAITEHGMSKIQVAAKVGASLPTIDAIIRRVKARLEESEATPTGGPDGTPRDTQGTATDSTRNEAAA